MNTAKHTPGPWKLDIYEEQNGDKHYFFKQDDKGEEDIIFNTSCPGLRDEDAHLIAAAPAMYEALQQSLVLVELAALEEWGRAVRGEQQPPTTEARDRLEKVKTALAQAEGR